MTNNSECEFKLESLKFLIYYKKGATFLKNINSFNRDFNVMNKKFFFICIIIYLFCLQFFCRKSYRKRSL